MSDIKLAGILDSHFDSRVGVYRPDLELMEVPYSPAFEAKVRDEIRLVVDAWARGRDD